MKPRTRRPIGGPTAIFQRAFIRLIQDRKHRAKCEECGRRNRPSSPLEFHHRNPKEKRFTIGSAWNKHGMTMEKLEREMTKCDLLCRECHKIADQRIQDRKQKQASFA